MTDKDPTLERLTNLTFAFLNAKDLGKQFLTPQWIHSNVADYKDKSDQAFEKAFQRDRATLQSVGVPIESVANLGYRLQEEAYSLPEVQFTPEEAAVLGLAGERGLSGELGVFARSGWTKIAASGADRELGKNNSVAALGDGDSLDALTLDRIIKACGRRLRITFDYTAHQQAEPVTRTFEPWGLVPLRGRMYLVGHDIDREASRVFRITRVSNVAATGKAQYPRQDVNLQKLVEETLRMSREVVSARVRVPADTLPEIESAGVREGDCVVLRDVDKAWLVRTCVAAAPDAVLLEPAELRAEIVEGLRAVRSRHV